MPTYEITYQDDSVEIVEGDELDWCMVDNADNVVNAWGESPAKYDRDFKRLHMTEDPGGYVIDAIRKDGHVVWFGVRANVKYIHEVGQ